MIFPLFFGLAPLLVFFLIKPKIFMIFISLFCLVFLLLLFVVTRRFPVVMTRKACVLSVCKFTGHLNLPNEIYSCLYSSFIFDGGLCTVTFLLMTLRYLFIFKPLPLPSIV